MRLWRVALTLSCTLPFALGLVQHPNLQLPPSAKAHRAAVKKIFKQSYQAYKKYAFAHDSLAPLNKSFHDQLGGFGASVFDSMSTMVIMGLDDIFNEAVHFVSKVDFNTPKEPVAISVFETTIRDIAGLISAFELKGKKHPVLIQKAKEAADKLTFAFVGENVIPFGYLNFATNTPFKNITNIAEAGSLALEWSRLSTYTKNDTYGRLAVNALKHIATTDSPLPGVPVQNIDPDTGHFVGKYVTWGGSGQDPGLQYFYLYARLSNTKDSTFTNAWAKAVDSSIKYLLRTSIVGNRPYLADWNDGTTLNFGGQRACLYGASLISGGKWLNNQSVVDLGLQLTETCWNLYASTKTGIGPRIIHFESFDGGGPPPADQADFNSEHGFWINSSEYILRPEVLESNFHAWRVTSDPKYLVRAASVIESFNQYLRAGVAYSGISDVNNIEAGRIDYMPSFWFSATLKFLYLTFDDPQHISLDDFVFNCEGHPLEINRGSGNSV